MYVSARLPLKVISSYRLLFSLVVMGLCAVRSLWQAGPVWTSDSEAALLISSVLTAWDVNPAAAVIWSLGKLSPRQMVCGWGHKET